MFVDARKLPLPGLLLLRVLKVLLRLVGMLML
jgi:hypothetical protein